MHLVVRLNRRGQLARDASGKHGLGYPRWHQDQHPVTAVLVVAVVPADPRAGERQPQRLIQAVTNRTLIRAGPVLGAELLHIYQDNAVVPRRLQHIRHQAPHLSSHDQPAD